MSPILRAILAILVSVMCFSVLNAMSKTLSQFYPVIEVIWARYFFAFILMLALFLPRSAVPVVVPLLQRHRLYAAGDGGGDLTHQPADRDRLVGAFPAGAGGTAPLGRGRCRLRGRADRRAPGPGAF